MGYTSHHPGVRGISAFLWGAEHGEQGLQRGTPAVGVGSEKKREKGLCYRCDEKWAPGHRCWKRELNVLLTMDDEESEPEGTESPVEAEQELESTGVG